MKINKLYVVVLNLIIVVALTACSTQNLSSDDIKTANPTAESFLSEKPEADIFVKGNIVYKNAEQIDWIQDTSFTLGEKVMTIKEVSNEGNNFKHGTASKLSVGTEIFELEKKNGHLLIALVNEEKIPYIGLIEG
ncbi:hypothetical protein GLW08_03910 [Pontibacillus yanchengensis]|uniref:Uncharacterized protein n=2 Tax=Pontibacillus yanchengensis TaxID=462910 RepID=A0ACC7VBY8_9BACI|nr:hypothetical protein [Pontibacillus yanchengensis]MYL35152.1 hypothetical protein [Pontibacillus yanchengensis]MYL52481.1 hypothetical protein [Pontibacillus yanchengensis]